jgi:hypothetical protein
MMRDCGAGVCAPAEIAAAKTMSTAMHATLRSEIIRLRSAERRDWIMAAP